MTRYSKIHIFNILKCLFWKQVKVQRFPEFVVSLCVCLIFWLIVESEVKHGDSLTRRTPELRSQNDSVEEVFFFPVTNLTKRIMSDVCSHKDCRTVGINEPMRNIKRKKSSNIAMVFHSNQSNNLHFTIRTHQNSMIHDTSSWKTKAKNFQKKTHRSFLQMHGTNFRNFDMRVNRLNSKSENSKHSFLATSIHIMDDRIIMTFLIKLAFVFIIKTVKDVMLERETLMKYMIISCNVPEIFIWFGYVIQRMITNVVIAFVLALILKDYELTKWYIIWMFLSLFCLCGIVLAFLISCMTEDYNLNILIMAISWFMVYPIYEPGMENCLYYCIWPCYALQLGFQVIDETTSTRKFLYEDVWSGSWIIKSMKKPNLTAIMLVMLFDVVWLSLATYFLNKMRDNK